MLNYHASLDKQRSTVQRPSHLWPCVFPVGSANPLFPRNDSLFSLSPKRLVGAKQREGGRGGWHAAAGYETMLSPYILFPVRIKSGQQLGGGDKETEPRISKVGPHIPQLSVCNFLPFHPSTFYSMKSNNHSFGLKAYLLKLKYLLKCKPNSHLYPNYFYHELYSGEDRIGRENGACIDKLGKLRQTSLGEVGRIQKRMSKVSNINCLLCNDAYSLRATGRKTIFLKIDKSCICLHESRVWKPAHVGLSLFNPTWCFLRKCYSLALSWHPCSNWEKDKGRSRPKVAAASEGLALSSLTSSGEACIVGLINSET